MKKDLVLEHDGLCPCGSGKEYNLCYKNHLASLGDAYFPYFDGFRVIPILDDQEDAFLAEDVLSSIHEDWEGRCECLEKAHVLLKRYPHISDLWSLLVIAYRIIGMERRFKKLLLKGRTRFPHNQTLILLSYLEGIEETPSALPFSLKTLTDVYIWGLIRMFHSISEGDLVSAVNFYGEMVTNAESDQQLSHWALVQGAFALSVFTEDGDPID